MKNIKQLFVCLLAISMTISVSAHAIATDAMESAISPIVITATEFDAISAQTEHVGRIMLPHTNPEGSNGNSCGEFVANEANVAFSILSAPATESYNVQLYHGTASSGGIPVYLYAKDVPIGSGVGVLGERRPGMSQDSRQSLYIYTRCQRMGGKSVVQTMKPDIRQLRPF